MNDATKITKKHIDRVKELLQGAAATLVHRGDCHDASKFSSIEMNALDAMQKIVDKEGQAAFGSSEYAKRLEILKPMLEHHYANNTHHPEHFENGVTGMDLFDVMEMFFDWKAASERSEESKMNIDKACERFEISDQLKQILRNTADNLKFDR